MIPNDAIIIWPSTHASIPTGWSRVTALDGRFPKATDDSVDPNITGGTATHSHTSPAHTHTMISHSHSGDTNNSSGDREDSSSDSHNPSAQDNHHHSYNISGISGGNLSNAVTYASTSSDPPYHKVIFIKPTGQKSIPAGAIVHFSLSDVPSGFTNCDGTGVTPDLRNKYLKGADTLGDAGGIGGTFNHEHVIDHTHTGVTHTHSGTTGSNSNGTNADNGGGQVTPNHTHGIGLDAAGSETGSAYTGNAGSADTVEPAYKKVMSIMNTSGSAKSAQKGIVALWLGELAKIPLGWVLCDGTKGSPDLRSKFVKIALDGTEIGNTGGSNTHTHSASNSHTHTAAGSHTHTGGTDTASASMGTGVGPNGASKPHSHSVPTSSSNTSSWNTTTTTGDSSDNQPLFTTVAYIQFKFQIGGAFIFNQLLKSSI